MIIERKLNTFCETPGENCTMNYCDENGCQNRKRELVDIEVEASVVVPKGFIPDGNWNPEEEVQVSDYVNCYFTPSTDTSSSTICANCGKEKFSHNPKYARGKIINYELEPCKKVAERYYQDEVSINAFINGYNLANQEIENIAKEAYKIGIRGLSILDFEKWFNEIKK